LQIPVAPPLVHPTTLKPAPSEPLTHDVPPSKPFFHGQNSTSEITTEPPIKEQAEPALQSLSGSVIPGPQESQDQQQPQLK